MIFDTVEEAIDAWKSLGDWKYADREAAWRWMFEHGRKAAEAARNENAALRGVLEEAVGGVVYLAQIAGVHEDKWMEWNRRALTVLRRSSVVDEDAAQPETQQMPWYVEWDFDGKEEQR